MKYSSRMFFGITLAVLVFSAANYYNVVQRQEAAQTANKKISQLVQIEKQQEHELGKRTKEQGCGVRGPLPDPECTPGDIFETATVEQICVKGYTKTVRNVPLSVKKEAYKEYGVSYPQSRGRYEVDHLIPLELGGSNTIANLFPEAATPEPGFHEKDLVENYLHQEVCAGRLALDGAQVQIATDWTKIYNTLTSEQINSLKNQFPSY